METGETLCEMFVLGFFLVQKESSGRMLKSLEENLFMREFPVSFMVYKTADQ